MPHIIDVNYAEAISAGHKNGDPSRHRTTTRDKDMGVVRILHDLLPIRGIRGRARLRRRFQIAYTNFFARV